GFTPDESGDVEFWQVFAGSATVRGIADPLWLARQSCIGMDDRLESLSSLDPSGSSSPLGLRGL
ncbi:hypothetical protein C8K36_12115, partial [Rhodococcus sp. OK519]